MRKDSKKRTVGAGEVGVPIVGRRRRGRRVRGDARLRRRIGLDGVGSRRLDDVGARLRWSRFGGCGRRGLTAPNAVVEVPLLNRVRYQRLIKSGGKA